MKRVGQPVVRDQRQSGISAESKSSLEYRYPRKGIQSDMRQASGKLDPRKHFRFASEFTTTAQLSPGRFVSRPAEKKYTPRGNVALRGHRSRMNRYFRVATAYREKSVASRYDKNAQRPYLQFGYF